MTLQVGDLVRVGRACLGNPDGARAVVVEVYKRTWARSPTEGFTLLFQNGNSDGFSEGDLELFKVEQIGHEPRLQTYRFTNVLTLDRDFKGGAFSCAFPEPGDGQEPMFDPREPMGQLF